jgi:hypothetical protein
VAAHARAGAAGRHPAPVRAALGSRLVRALAAAALTLSCNATFPERGPVHVSPRLTGQKRAAIERGMADWCRATNGVACPTLLTGRGDFEFIVERLPRGNAITRRRPTTVRVGIDLDAFWPGYWLGAIKHEIGHAYGLSHAPEGLMRGEETGGPWTRSRVPYDCIDQRTLAAFCELHTCNGVSPECSER